MKRSSAFVIAFLLSMPAWAQEPQEQSTAEVAPPVEQPRSWQPLGQLPVDQAGGGLRGYAIAGEGADVAEPGATNLSLQTVAANNFYRQLGDPFSVSQRDETHTLALSYRRGFSFGRLRRIELGGQVQLQERDTGFLNGFISGFENLWVSLTGSSSAKNQLRTDGGGLLPLGTTITNNNRLLYQATGNGSGLGDVRLVAKALLHDDTASSGGSRVAARVVLNIAGASAFTEGNFAGFGVSFDKPLSSRLGFHGDVRANVLFDRVSEWNLPLKRATFGFSAGPELKLTTNTSVGLQFDGNSTPYQPTGSEAFDASYGSITLGVSRRLTTARTPLLLQFYARENLDLPFRVRWNTDPDFAVGIKITAHFPGGR